MTIRLAIIGVLRRRRYALHWTLERLAEESGMDQSTVSRVLGGSPKAGSMATLDRLAEAMGVHDEVCEGLADMGTEPAMIAKGGT